MNKVFRNLLLVLVLFVVLSGVAMAQEGPKASYANGVLTVNGVRYEMVSIPGGTFQMGSNSGDADEKPVHSVTISSFYMGKTEVTQGLWQALMGENPATFQNGKNYPVEQVSWDDCIKFINKLNDLTEGEWEYACRAGTSGDRYGDLDEIAWYSDNSGGSTQPVGQKKPNTFGLYDMLGNVWEWCQDMYDENFYSNSPAQNPRAGSGSGRVFRGGGWEDGAGGVRSAFRGGVPGYRCDGIGFRLASGSGG
jgi:formylglycine-generating enzyme required for sulfatase activity